MSHAEDLDPDAGDEVPGGSNLRSAMGGYMLGFALAVLLTVASFYIAKSPVIYRPAMPAALITLAIAQIGVHLVFFLHITTGPDNTNNVLALAFGILIVILIVGGSVWIINHLNERMMTMDQMMQMQR